MIFHAYVNDEDCVFIEVEINPFEILLGEGHSLADALRDLAMEVEDHENEVGYEVEV